MSMPQTTYTVYPIIQYVLFLRIWLTLVYISARKSVNSENRGAPRSFIDKLRCPKTLRELGIIFIMTPIAVPF